MNRHERRAAGAQARKAAHTDHGFADFSAHLRQVRAKLSDREIGESWMRSEAFKVAGADSILVHEIGQQPKQSDDDWLISLAYETLRFKAYVPAAVFERSIGDIEKHIVPTLAAKTFEAKRAGARQFLFDMLLENKGLTDGTMAAWMAATIGWLVKTSDIGEMISAAGVQYRSLHYEITTPTFSGRKALNFRLVLQEGHDDTLPDWVKQMPPTARPGEPAKEFFLGIGDDDESKK
jgi:hypothetical protein